MRSCKNILANIPPGWLNFVVLIVGIVVVLSGALVDVSHATWKQVLLGVGGSVIASAVVAYLTSHYLLSQNEALQLIDAWRLDGLFQTRAEANERSNELLPTTKELDVIAFGLRSFRDSQSGQMKELVKSGLRLRILTLNPNSQFVTARTKSENLGAGHLKKEIKDLIKWVADLRSFAEDPKAIEVRVYDAPNLDFYFRTDDTVFVGPYLHDKTSQQTPTYSFLRGGIGFDFWEGYFNRLWHDTSFCQSVDVEESDGE